MKRPNRGELVPRISLNLKGSDSSKSCYQFVKYTTRNSSTRFNISVILFARIKFLFPILLFEKKSNNSMEHAIKIMIYIHAFFGGIGLITGLGSVVVQKGSNIHKKFGTAFSYSMILSSIISLIVARMPNHENLFLFLIGIFTIYLVLSGTRALKLRAKYKTKADLMDKVISGSMLLLSLIMLSMGIIGILQEIANSILYVFFGGFGLLMSIKDFRTFKTFSSNKNAWIKSHIGRMVGALIASITAFMVAGLNIGTVVVWITPTIVGTIYIIFWTRKFSNSKVVVKE